MSYHPIIIQTQDPDTEAWADAFKLHASQVNKAGGGESFAAGREVYHPRLTFDVAWCKKLEALRYSTQPFRVIYQGHSFNIVDYDDYMERHVTVRLTGEAYG